MKDLTAGGITTVESFGVTGDPAPGENPEVIITIKGLKNLSPSYTDISYMHDVLYSRQRICELFGVPEHRLGELPGHTIRKDDDL